MNVSAFQDRWTKQFLKTFHFLEIPQIFYYGRCIGKFLFILFSYIVGIGNFELFCELQQKQLFAKIFKATVT